MMKRAIFIYVTLSLLLSACGNSKAGPDITATLSPTNTPIPTSTATAVPSTPTLAPETDFIKGVTLNNFGPRLDTANAQRVITQYIIPSGANYVVLIPTCWSVNMNDTSIVCSNRRLEGGLPPVSDNELVRTIQYLHSRGLRVILKPQALVQSVITGQEVKHRHWNEEQRKEWFNSYIAFITHYAQIAEEQKVDLFVIGNEQEDNTEYEQEWRSVIAAVRENYLGPITYAANAWAFEASRVSFWDALDYIGTNGYQFGFVNKNDPTLDEMTEAWQPYAQQLEELSDQYGKQVIITEIGARSMEDFNTGNADDSKTRPYDGQEQAEFYTAFFEALKDKPWLKGILLWDVYTDPLQGGPYDISYTFIAKPAEQVVRQYFGGLELTPAPTASFVEDLGNSMVIYDEYLSGEWHIWTDPNAIIVPDPYFSTGYQSDFSIRLPLSSYPGIEIDYAGPLDMSRYKWLEFYIMVGANAPQNLLVQFEYWTLYEVTHSRLALVNDPGYIEGGQYLPGTWQRIRIPLIDLGITDQRFTGFGINNCAWPCELDRRVDDIYIDNIRLISGKSP